MLVYNCNTHADTASFDMTESVCHTWTTPLFAKEEYMVSEYIQCTGYNMGISYVVITKIHV